MHPNHISGIDWMETNISTLRSSERLGISPQKQCASGGAGVGLSWVLGEWWGRGDVSVPNQPPSWQTAVVIRVLPHFCRRIAKLTDVSETFTMQGKFIDESTYKTAQATFPLVPSDEHRNFFQHQKNRRKNQTNTACSTPTNQNQK